MTPGARAAAEVFEDHLRLSQEGSIEDDLRRNYAEDLVVLCQLGVYHGHDGLRELSRRMKEELPKATFEYKTRHVAGELAFLEWTATSPKGVVRDGADSYVIRNGRIVAQTIHYTIRAKSATRT